MCVALFPLIMQVFVDIVNTDLVSGLERLHHNVDILLFNPPYVPTPDEEGEIVTE
jgi:release factor glutamine methyltransferase